MTSSTVFVKTRQSPNHLAVETVACLREFKIYAWCFLFSSPLLFVSPHTLRFQSADWGRVLLKIAKQHLKSGMRWCKEHLKKKIRKAITLQLNVFCLDLWLLIRLHASTASPCLEDSIQLFRAKNTPSLLELSRRKYLIFPSWVCWLTLNHCLSVCLVWLHTACCYTVCCLQNKGQMCRVPN